MSLELNWSLLDEHLAECCREVLNRAFNEARRPAYLAPITVSSFAFGDDPPEIELVDIRDVQHDFIGEEDELTSSPSPEPPQRAWSTQSDVYRPSLAGTSLRSSFGRPMAWTSPTPVYSEQFERTPEPELEAGPSTPAPSLQLHVHVSYSGTLRIGLETSLLINYPAPLFMSLPLSLTVVGIAFSGTFVIAYEGSKRRVHISVLDPAAEGELDVRPLAGRNAGGPGERLLTGLKIKSEVGQVDKHVLRNVGKVEKFVLEVVRGALEVRQAFESAFLTVQDELVWPAFQTIAF